MRIAHFACHGYFLSDIVGRSAKEANEHSQSIFINQRNLDFHSLEWNCLIYKQQSHTCPSDLCSSSLYAFPKETLLLSLLTCQLIPAHDTSEQEFRISPLWWPAPPVGKCVTLSIMIRLRNCIQQQFNLHYVVDRWALIHINTAKYSGHCFRSVDLKNCRNNYFQPNVVDNFSGSWIIRNLTKWDKKKIQLRFKKSIRIAYPPIFTNRKFLPSHLIGIWYQIL